MYHDLREQFWWTRMKHETARYMSECDTCRKVKTDYMKSRRLLQQLSITDWKWDDISMDFILGLPLTVLKFKSIWVIMDQLTKPYTSYPCTLATMRRSMLRSTSLMCYDCMGFWRQSLLIEGRSLLLGLGSNDTLPLKLTWSIVQLITHRWLAKQSEWIKFWRTCWEHVWWNIKVVGRRICHGLSSCTTIATKRASRWHRLKCCTNVDVAHPSTRLGQEKRLSFVPILLMRPKWWSITFKTTWSSWSHPKRAILTKGIKPWSSRL
jgi:hypothetical protein